MRSHGILQDLAGRGVLVWPESDRLKVDAPSEALTEEDKAALREHKTEILEHLKSVRICMDCGGDRELQDLAWDIWWCPICRNFRDGRGNKPTVIERPHPLTQETEDSHRLVADLMRAGCVFVLDGSELRLRYPEKMSMALWTRFENAGPGFERLARVAAEDPFVSELVDSAYLN